MGFLFDFALATVDFTNAISAEQVLGDLLR